MVYRDFVFRLITILFLPAPAVFSPVRTALQEWHLIIKILDHDLGFEIDLVIIFRAAAVLFLLPVLAHHDERRLDRRDAGQNQIQQDKRERIERICRQDRIDDHPQEQHARKRKDERPASSKFCDRVRRALPEGVFFRGGAVCREAGKCPEAEGLRADPAFQNYGV